jgi:hypothetical protein
VIANYPEPAETGGMMGAIIAQTVVGAGQTTLNFLDAFCVTVRCKEAQRQRRSSLEIARIEQETAAITAQGQLAGVATAKRTQQTVLVLGFGVLALATYFIAGRGR